MNSAARARAFREVVLPNSRLHQVPKRSYNPLLRRGLCSVEVADRACVVLCAACRGVQHPDLIVKMEAIVYLTGLLDLDAEDGPVVEETLQAQGFDAFTWLGTRIVQGLPWDTHSSYWTNLIGHFDVYRLVRCALGVAELEDTLSLPLSDRRRRKVVGDATHVLVPMLSAEGGPETALRLLLKDLVRFAICCPS